MQSKFKRALIPKRGSAPFLLLFDNLMRLLATTLLRNEAWICGLSLRAALRWVDGLEILAHACTDETIDIVQQVSSEHPGRVNLLIEDGDQHWSEMAHRDRLLGEARKHGATHIAVVDADEVLCGNLLPLIREQIACLPPGGFLRTGMPCCWRSLTEYRRDGRLWSNRNDLMLAFADHPNLKWQKNGGYDHHCREPKGSRHAAQMRTEVGGVMHLQWVSFRRLQAKQSWYQCIERLKYPNKPVAEIARTYSFAMDEAGLQLAPTPPEWWEPYSDILSHANLDVEPWHEQDIRRMFDEHGSEMFQGLNLQGEVFQVTACAQAN